MNPRQLKRLIHTTLKSFGFESMEAVDLLMLTAAQESHCGQHIEQLGGGPARGIFQMELNTLSDIVDNYLSYRPDLYDSAISFIARGSSLELNLTGNLLFQVVIARVHYLRVPEKIPTLAWSEYDYISALAGYWKKHWNTEKGAGTVAEAIQNYNTYVRRG